MVLAGFVPWISGSEDIRFQIDPQSGADTTTAIVDIAEVERAVRADDVGGIALTAARRTQPPPPSGCAVRCLVAAGCVSSLFDRIGRWSHPGLRVLTVVNRRA